MQRLVLVRHGETEWNARGRFQGHSDVPLNERGRLQALAVGRKLAGEEIHAAYASDLRRAWETAEAILASRALSVRAEPRLREVYFGQWEGLTYAEIEERYPGAFATWWADPVKVAPPGGEALCQVAVRVRAALADIACAHRCQTVLLVAHGGTLQVLLALVLGLVPASPWRFPLGAGSISEVCFHPEGPALTRLNEIGGLVDADERS